MKISKDFDGGNIEIIDQTNPELIRLNIELDNASGFYQWFYFLVDDFASEKLHFSIENAGGASFAEGYEDYQACASYNNQDWFRVPTEYDGSALSISFSPSQSPVWFASFAPYSMARHDNLIGHYRKYPSVNYANLGLTIDGNNIDLLQIGDDSIHKKKVWVHARQHPGEVMAEWWVEGFLNSLLSSTNPVAKKLLDQCVFYVVPNMNPDGSIRGNLRTNGAGANLNREWGEANTKNSPEVAYVMKKMRETGVDFSLDLHGEEMLSYCFLATAEGIPNFSSHQRKLTNQFVQAYCDSNQAMQNEHGYPIPEPGKADISICTYWVAEEFDAVAFTLEMPFSDDANNREPKYGWSPDKCLQLGADVLPALQKIVNFL